MCGVLPPNRQLAGCVRLHSSDNDARVSTFGGRIHRLPKQECETLPPAKGRYLAVGTEPRS
jgi:hypothetical protein